MVVHWAEDEGVSSDAVRLAVAIDRPVYHCIYLALVHRVNGTLVTADERFVDALEATDRESAIMTRNSLLFD